MASGIKARRSERNGYWRCRDKSVRLVMDHGAFEIEKRWWLKSLGFSVGGDQGFLGWGYPRLIGWLGTWIS